MLNLPILEHKMFLHLFKSFLISFNNVLQIVVYKSCTSLVKYIPEYFILFHVIVNEIFLLLAY